MNPFEMPANAECRRDYSKDMCSASLEIPNRTVMVATHPLHTEQDIADIIHNIGQAARVVFADLPRHESDIRNAKAVDNRNSTCKLPREIKRGPKQGRRENANARIRPPDRTGGGIGGLCRRRAARRRESGTGRRAPD
jgi:hypothetical protein